MSKHYVYEFSIDDDWERLTDTKTGKMVEGHRLHVDDVFFLTGLGEQLEMKELPDPDDVYVKGI